MTNEILIVLTPRLGQTVHVHIPAQKMPTTTTYLQVGAVFENLVATNLYSFCKRIMTM